MPSTRWSQSLRMSGRFSHSKREGKWSHSKWVAIPSYVRSIQSKQREERKMVVVTRRRNPFVCQVDSVRGLIFACVFEDFSLFLRGPQDDSTKKHRHHLLRRRIIFPIILKIHGFFSLRGPLRLSSDKILYYQSVTEMPVFHPEVRVPSPQNTVSTRRTLRRGR